MNTIYLNDHNLIDELQKEGHVHRLNLLKFDMFDY